LLDHSSLLNRGSAQTVPTGNYDWTVGAAKNNQEILVISKKLGAS
jgi:hypothetical protein